MLLNRKGSSKSYKVKKNTEEQNSRPPGGQVCMSTRRKLLGSGAGDVMKDDVGFIEEEQRDLQLSVFEKKYLLCSERGDVPAVRALLEKHKSNNRFNINCRDAVGRSALIVAIENENMELIDLLLTSGIEPGDALLHAISEEYVEAVEVLLQHEEKIFEAGRPYSWEAVDNDMATFTKDITPLILAAHRDNYEIIKLLLDRGASLPMPHNVRCGCDECVVATKDDCLRHSRSRINAYRALTSPSLICLSSTDPIQTAFNLSSDLAKLSSAEHEFKTDYRELRHKCENYATALLDHTRTSYELEVMLNYDPKGPAYEKGERMKLERLKLAILCKQKTFVAHPNVQQLLASVWYEGSPGFRRKGIVGQLMDISKMGMMCPVYSVAYMLAPDSELGQTMKKPFTKFIGHSTAYCFFLLLLIMASQRVETLIMEWIGTNYFLSKVRENQEKERGKLPGIVESAIVLFVIGFVWAEIKQLWDAGLYSYLMDMWNVVDFFTNMLYLTCIGLRVTAWYIVQRELRAGKEAHLPREDWDPYDPMLISEGIFGAANIFSFLKMVHIFSVNPHLGPLQISLGRMVFDIIKFFFIYSLVLFAFGCGMNQLLWYYADIDKELCYSGPGGSQNSNYEQSCLIWRRFANLFETSQSLFWASFGLVELENFELTGIKSYTRFWSLLMFGSYSVINVVVLLNLLIAMMSNSYQIISERADVEWKFARSKLWMSYFEDGATVPPPFNIFPTLKSFKKLLCCKIGSSSMSLQEEEEYNRDVIYRSVMRCLVRRYVTSQQRKAEETGVTEDDVNEVKQAVTSFRSELFEILRTNGMKGVSTSTETLSRKERLRERRLLKDFNIDLVETVMEAFMKDDKKNKFSLIRRLTNKREKAKRNWNAIVGAARSRQNPIGSSASVHGGSLKELREKVFQEQELPSKRAVRRFVQAAKRIIQDEQIRKASMTDQCDNVNNFSAIEEEEPGTFSTNATPRNSMQQEAFNEESLKLSKENTDKSPSTRKNSGVEKLPKGLSDKSPTARKGSDVQKMPNELSDKSPSTRKGSDVSPSARKGSDVSPSARKGSDVSPSVRKGSDVSPTVRKGSDVSPSAGKGSDVPSSARKGSDVSPSVRKASDVSPSARKGSDVSPSARKTSDVSPSARKVSDVSPSARKASDVSPSARKTSDVSPSARKVSDVSPSARKGSDVSPSARIGSDVQKLPKEISDKSLTAPKDSGVKKLPKEFSDKSPAARKGPDVQKLTEKYSSKYPTARKSSDVQQLPKELSDKSTKPRKSSDVVVDIETESIDPRSKKLESCPEIDTSDSKVKGSQSNVKGMVSKIDEKAGEKKEDESEIRGHSDSVPKDKSVSEESAKKKSAKVAPKAGTAAWL